jgi:hypothetical protein
MSFNQRKNYLKILMKIKNAFLIYSLNFLFFTKMDLIN